MYTIKPQPPQPEALTATSLARLLENKRKVSTGGRVSYAQFRDNYNWDGSLQELACGAIVKYLTTTAYPIGFSQGVIPGNVLNVATLVAQLRGIADVIEENCVS